MHGGIIPISELIKLDKKQKVQEVEEDAYADEDQAKEDPVKE